jgi:hypothetical protein
VDINKILKAPAFEGTNGWKDLANPGKTRYPAGSNHLARFFVEDGEVPIEVRYAKTRRKDPNDSDLWIYFPVRIDFPGAGMQLSEDLDLAVFAYFHPTNGISPFHKVGEKTKFEFVDTLARSTKRISDLDALGEAILHAKTIKGEDARILAKGLGISGIHAKEDYEVTAELMNYASQNASVYLSKKEQRITMIEGQIEHFCDKEIFKMSTMGETRRWSWSSGQRSGETILDIYNVTVNAREALKNHILNDLNNYMFLLNNMNDSISARDKAIRDLEVIPDEKTGVVIGNKLPEYLANIGSGGVLPKTFNESVKYLYAKTGKRQSNIQNGALWKLVVSGEITDGNVQEWIDNNCKVAETV